MDVHIYIRTLVLEYENMFIKYPSQMEEVVERKTGWQAGGVWNDGRLNRPNDKPTDGQSLQFAKNANNYYIFFFIFFAFIELRKQKQTTTTTKKTTT